MRAHRYLAGAAALVGLMVAGTTVPMPLNHTMVVGSQTYHRISFNHRYMSVRTTDVTLN